jgi:hypothetical protein
LFLAHALPSHIHVRAKSIHLQKGQRTLKERSNRACPAMSLDEVGTGTLWHGENGAMKLRATYLLISPRA